VLRAQAATHHSLAEDLQRHATTLTDLVERSRRSWEGADADAFHVAAARNATLLADTARTAALIGDVHDAHATQQSHALEIIREIALQIGVLLAMIAAAAFFPPLLSVLEMQLAALATTAGRLIGWLADLLSAIVRFLVQARAWISQLSSLTWRTESFSLAYGRAAFEGLRDATVDVLATLTARGISHRPLNLTMLWSALGSGAAGGLFGAIEGSGLKKVLTASGDVKRSADGAPQFVAFGDQIKSRLNAAARREKPSAGSTVPSAAELKQALGGPADAVDTLLVARAQARKVGLEGLPRERRSVTDDLISSATARQQARLRLDGARARARLAQAEERVTTHSAQTWATETARALGLPARADAARAAQSASHKLQPVDGLREAASSHARTAERTALEADARATSAERELAAAEARYRAYQDFATAGRSAGDRLSFPRFVADAWHRNPWREGFATEYRHTARTGAERKPAAWVRTNSGGLPSRVLDAIGAPKTWREALVYEPVKGLLKGSSAGTIATAAAYRPGTSNPLAWLAVPLSGASGALRDLARGPMVNRLIPDRSIEEVVVRTALGGLGKQTHAAVMEQILAPRA
jgi:hypothetical protein